MTIWYGGGISPRFLRETKREKLDLMHLSLHVLSFFSNLCAVFHMCDERVDKCDHFHIWPSIINTRLLTREETK